MIDFMYEGEIRVADEDLETLLATAETFQVKGLCKLRKEREAALENEEVIQNSPLSTETQTNTNTDPNPPKSRKRRKQSHSPILNQVNIREIFGILCFHFIVLLLALCWQYKQRNSSL